MHPTTAEQLGEAAYEAYRADTGGLSTVSDAVLPPWPNLSPATQHAWIAAARAVHHRALGGTK